MNGTALTTVRFRWLAIFALAAFAATAVACGGTDGTPDPTSTSDSTGATSPTSTVGSSGTSPTATSDSGGALDGAFDCSSLSAIAGYSGVAFDLDLLTVSAPDDEFGQAVTEFFTDALTDALNVGVSTNCYYELKVIGEPDALWMSFELSSPPGADAIGEISTELTSLGVPVNSSTASSMSFAGENFAFFGFDSLPDIDAGIGGILFETDSDVLLVVGEEFANTPGFASTPVASSTIDPGAPSTTSTPAAVSATGVVGEVEAVLRSWLEQVVLAELTLTSNFTSSIGLDTIATLIYEADSTPVPDIAALERAVVNFGARLDSALNVGGTASVVFSNAEVAGYLVSGTVTVAEVVTVLVLIAN